MYFDIIDQIEKKHSNKIEFRNVMRHYGPYSLIEILNDSQCHGANP